jgi:catechol 2,3-dioxygenase-like lactoylglutathione lyase family enzyme
MAEASLSGMTLHVGDVERSLEFYRQVPGGQVVSHEAGREAILRFGGGLLRLRQGDGSPQLMFETDEPDGLKRGFTLDPDGNTLAFVGTGTAGNVPADFQHGVPFNPQMRDEDAGLG